MNLDQELALAKKLATQASKEVMKIYATDFNVTIKSDNTPITQADKVANNIIVQGIKKMFPQDAILSEEEKDNLQRLQTQRVWIIDPIDGTREFISKNGEFTVNIALAVNEEPVLGVVVAPALGQTYYATKNKGAFIESDDFSGAINVSSRDQFSSLVLVHSRSHFSEQAKQLVNAVGFKERKTMGSSLKGCLVARGHADVYYRVAGISEWDICAMHAILNEAGASVTDTSGNPIMYNQKQTIKNQGLMISNSVLHEELLALSNQIETKNEKKVSAVNQ